MLATQSEVFRTPDDRFRGLAGYDFDPHYLTWRGLRMHYLDVRPADDEAPVFLLVHGEPTWSYIYRDFVDPLVAAGFRVVAPDLIGFGRSDKVADDAWYCAERHIEALDNLIGELDLRDVNLVVHDWGGPIGLRQAADMPERFARIFVLNSWLHHKDMIYSPGIEKWREWATDPERHDLSAGQVVANSISASACGEKGVDVDAVRSAYDAPFPDAGFKAGVRRFAAILPFASPEDGNAVDQTRTYLSIRTFPGPVHFIWADDDELFPEKSGREWARLTAGSTFEVVPGAAHFLQEQAGSEIAAAIVRHCGV